MYISMYLPKTSTMRRMGHKVNLNLNSEFFF